MYVLKTSDLPNVERKTSVCIYAFSSAFLYSFSAHFIFFFSSSTSLFAQASLLPARTLRRFVQQAVGCNDEEEASVEEAFGEITVDR